MHTDKKNENKEKPVIAFSFADFDKAAFLLVNIIKNNRCFLAVKPNLYDFGRRQRCRLFPLHNSIIGNNINFIQTIPDEIDLLFTGFPLPDFFVSPKSTSL